MAIHASYCVASPRCTGLVRIAIDRAFVISHGQDWNEKNHLEQGGFLGDGGERGIRTPDRAINPILP